MDRNPQKQHMADESMVRTLAAQVEAIWPQERALIRGYGLPGGARALDAGCGTGEFTVRLAQLLPAAQVIGVDVLPERVAYARERYAALAPRLRFHPGDAFALDFPADSFDFVACRHVLQSVPQPERMIAELVRVTRRGGRLHLLVEDYGMIHAYPTERDLDGFWQRAMAGFARHMHVDPRIGRRAWSELAASGMREIEVRYLTVDTVRVPRPVLARIFDAWRDGYACTVAELAGLDTAEARAHFDELIACVNNSAGYAVWLVPIVTGLKP